ncbi:MAG: archease [Candidatus Babeliaceae bacterium]|nr:archease [Candidatus Babeliaceae bacterium]
MEKWFLIPHVADIRLHAEGTTLEELFSAALEGMAAILLPEGCTGNYTESISFSLTAPDTTVLLIDFLSEALSYSSMQRILYCTAAFSELSEKTLSTTLMGKKIECFDEDIKAVTYHEAEVHKNTTGTYETIIVFDI